MHILLLLEDYQRRKRLEGQSPNTISNTTSVTNIFARDTGLYDTDDWTTDAILEWALTRREKGMKKWTVRGNVKSLRTLLKHLEEGMKASHRVELHRLKTKRPEQAPRHCPRAYEVASIIEAAEEPEIKVLIAALATSGMRISECLKIRSENITDDGECYVNGKGDKDRPVYLTRELGQEVKNLAPDGGYCWPDPYNPSQPLPRHRAYYRVKKACRRAGRPATTQHDMRHYYATDLLRNGAGLTHVQHLLGHADPNTTKIYEHLLEEDLASAHEEYSTKVWTKRFGCTKIEADDET
ncbi:tyrosine-type recombinase/integrase [Candidatus Saccharibacteria bacterium]|nr:tyrosine-type recombinase/integrase [Candidatus Saccharibacteria bacterium]